MKFIKLMAAFRISYVFHGNLNVSCIIHFDAIMYKHNMLPIALARPLKDIYKKHPFAQKIFAAFI